MEETQETPKAKLKTNIGRCFEGDWRGTEATIHVTRANAVKELFDRKRAPYGSELRKNTSIKRAKSGASMRRDTIVEVLLVLGESDPKSAWGHYVVQAEAVSGPSPTHPPATSIEPPPDPVPRRPPNSRVVLVLACLVALGALVLLVLKSPSSSDDERPMTFSVAPTAGTPVEGQETSVLVRVDPVLLEDPTQEIRVLVKPLNSRTLYVQRQWITDQETTCYVLLGASAPMPSATFQVILASFTRGLISPETLDFAEGTYQYRVLASTQITRSQ